MEAPPPQDIPRPPEQGAWLWPALIAGALTIHAVVCLTVTLVVTRDPSFAVEPEYYRKAIQWDAAAAQLRADKALGWTVKMETGPRSGILGERRLACRLADREGKPIAGAAVEIETFHLARGADRIRGILADEGGGLYAAALKLRRPGLWECRLTVRQGDQVFTHAEDHLVEDGAWRP